MDKKEILSLSFKGDASYTKIDAILDEIYEQLEDIESRITVRKKVYSVLVEILQNMCNYAHSDYLAGYEGQQNEKLTVFNVTTTDTTYEIETGNFISNDYVKILKAWLDKLATLTKEDVSLLYKEFLKNGNLKPSAGAGLGFLEIAKKSKREWIYAFEPVDDEISFFNFKVVVDKSSKN